MRSDRPEKKYYAEVEVDGTPRRVYFGDAKMKDFTLHNPLEREERKRAYISRHKSREDWNDPTTPGFYARWILWNKPTIAASERDMKKRFF